jgi:MATE family multidrug resistance protein
MHVFWCYIFVHKLELDITGVSLTMLITYITLLAVISVYASFIKEIKDGWFLPNKDTFKDIWAYLKLGVPGTLMLMAELWTFELLTLYASFISVDAIAG